MSQPFSFKRFQDAQRQVQNLLLGGGQSSNILSSFSIEEHTRVHIGAWDIYRAKSSSDNVTDEFVSVWVFDRTPYERFLSSKQVQDIANQCRREVQQLAKLRHPHVLRVVNPLQELRRKIVFVTEHIEACLAGYDGFEGDYARISTGEKTVKVSDLEMRYGFLCLAEALEFLHSHAKLVHRGLCPASVFITSSGRWKLAALQFSIYQDHGPNSSLYDFEHRLSDGYDRLIRPCLDFTAPECVDFAWTTPLPARPSNDVFSFGCLMALYICRTRILPENCTIECYRSAMMKWSPQFSIHSPIGRCVLESLRHEGTERPGMKSIMSVLADSKGVHALVFLDQFIQKSPEQRRTFLRELPMLSQDFDERLVSHFMVPFLLEQSQDDFLCSLSIPLLLRICGKIECCLLEKKVIPVLSSMLEKDSSYSRTAEIALAGPDILQVSSSSVTVGLVMKAITNSFKKEAPQSLQEKGLDTILKMAKMKMLPSATSATLSPLLMGACLQTTSPTIRVRSLECLSKLASLLNERDMSGIVDQLMVCVSRDQTTSTALAISSLALQMGKKSSTEFLSTKLIPLVSPLLSIAALSDAQFGEIARSIKEMVNMVEQLRPSSAQRETWDDFSISQDVTRLESLPKIDKSTHVHKSRTQPMSSNLWQHPKGSASVNKDPFVDLLS